MPSRARRGLPPADHRPFPLPRAPWVMRQEWRDVLFAHWPVPAEVLRPLVPAALPLDLFGGQAWVGVVPFGVTGLRLRLLPPVPPVSRFLELNVRTYVTVGGRPGVYFFSLDAASLLAVMGARTAYRLAYFHARMRSSRRGDEVRLETMRIHRGAPGAEFAGAYRPTGPVSPAAPGSHDAWLTERYCLYTIGHRGEVRRGEIHHPPWPLQPAEATFDRQTMTAAAGITLPPQPPLLHYARYLDVHIWALTTVHDASLRRTP